MSKASPQLRRFARRLLAQETPPRSQSSDGEKPLTFQVFDELRPHMVNLMGMGGFRGLLSRAIALGGEELRWLRAVHVNANGSLTGFEEYASLGPGQFAEGKVVLLAQVLGMLIALVGVRLTLRLVLDIWPKLSLGDLNLGNGEAHEKED
ncbi:MAG: hypothetical protein QOD26_2549 [Betaproteobacteria bacterium]|jgi:hypothetical protein|nr:hypothetical protein [Betaproteobacteria bacterium]